MNLLVNSGYATMLHYATTRPARVIAGDNKYHLDDADFTEAEAQGMFGLRIDIYGHRYGVSARDLKLARSSSSSNYLLDLPLEAVALLPNSTEGIVGILLHYSSEREVVDRLNASGRLDRVATVLLQLQQYRRLLKEEDGMPVWMVKEPVTLGLKSSEEIANIVQARIDAAVHSRRFKWEQDSNGKHGA